MLRALFSDNPFFMRELRQFRHRRSIIIATLAGWLVFSLSALGLGFVIVDVPNAAGSTLRPVDLIVLAFILMFPNLFLGFCAIKYGGERILRYEHQQGTLQDVLILPYRPEAWLGRKLVFPLFLLTAAWICGLPFYLVTCLLGLTTVSVFWNYAPFPWVFNVVMLFLFLVVSPGMAERSNRTGERKAARSSSNNMEVAMDDSIMAVCLFMAIWAAMGAFCALGPELLSQWRPFYFIVAPPLFLWCCAVAAMAWACYYSGLAHLAGNRETARLASQYRWTALAIAHCVWCGFFWDMLTTQDQWMVSLAFPFLYVCLKWNKWRNERLEKWEDPRSAREITWLIDRWDNPVFIKDLRIYMRSRSLTRQVFYSILATVVTCAILYWMSHIFFGVFLPFSAMILAYIFIYAAIGPAEQAASRWLEEHRGSTHGLLLLTPMASQELLLGRLGALGLFHCIAGCCLLLPFACVVLLTYQGGGVTGLAVALVMMPLVLGWMIVRSGDALQGKKRTLKTYVVLGMLGLVEVVLLTVCVAQAIDGGLSPGVLWLATACAVCFQIFLNFVWYRFRLSELEAHRRGDIQITEDRIKSA